MRSCSLLWPRVASLGPPGQGRERRKSKVRRPQFVDFVLMGWGQKRERGSITDKKTGKRKRKENIFLAFLIPMFQVRQKVLRAWQNNFCLYSIREKSKMRCCFLACVFLYYYMLVYTYQLKKRRIVVDRVFAMSSGVCCRLSSSPSSVPDHQEARTSFQIPEGRRIVKQKIERRNASSALSLFLPPVIFEIAE